MCGCNTKGVQYAKSNEVIQEQFTVPAPTRKIMQSCDTRGVCGRIETNDFVTSEKAAVRFERTALTNTNFPKEAYKVSMPSISTTGLTLSAIGLRQLAEEFAAMADELDGQKTAVVSATSVKVKAVRKSTKKKTNSKAKKIVVKK